MRVIYADPGLRDERGHWANSCRAIRRELERRGIQVLVLAQASVTPELQTELNAIPLFRAWTSQRSDGDPISGGLNWFDMATRATVQDLGRMQGIAADDIVYLNSAEPAQFMALIKWSQSLPAERRPHVVMEFGADPGVDVEFADGLNRFTLRLRDYRNDPRAMFYRHAACQLQEADLQYFHMMTFDAGTSAIYSQLLGKPVGVLPLPQLAQIAVSGRAGRRPITVSTIGHQRPDKGYHLMPQIARLLLAHEPDVRILIHNCVPEQMPKVQEELRAHAAVESRITLNEQTAGPELWASLLRQSDLILCPYEPARYAASYSFVATEALVHAIPVVVPANTSLSRLLDAYGGPGTTFESHDPVAIVAAIRRALADFDAVATRAGVAAERWNATMGVGNMVTALLAHAKPA